MADTIDRMSTLGNPGKIIGLMFDEHSRQWVPVEAAAGLGNPGKIIGYDPDTGQFIEAAAGLGGVSSINWWGVAGFAALGAGLYWLVRRSSHS